ncbi:fetuin B isoform X2 [Sinocyclocheilus grahami]|uniref:fetuin B isoform X2 n=1 Tax=Sinocyclocheilus grahami TaxID=75366 RepID=UPI0007AD5823|nr:PREDICTED: antihemorrhagic factor cHLP-B-like isoform X2 [Sinocyclocheilus grahami]
MKQCVVLMMTFLCVHGAPVDVLAPGSCQDAVASGAAAEAMNKINLDRTEGYVFSLDRLTNVHHMKHGETGIVFYLTFDVLETKCHAISKKNWRNCESRNPEQYPVYGQCKAVMYMNRVHRVSRLYKYSCTVRPVPASKIRERCPDCPVQLPEDHEAALRTAKMGMEKYNNESALANYFVPLNITRAFSQLHFGRFYSVEFTIQETVCSSKTNTADVSECEVMACEFAHKGFCKASHTVTATGEEHLSVQCEIFEPEAAEEEKKKHLIGGELDHSHSSTTGSATGHDHDYDHTKLLAHKHDHEHTSGHHHTHEHGKGHGHTHSHDHDHAHAHHAKAHEHGHHHTHEHGKGHGHTHSHDHDHAHAHHAKAHEHGQDEWEHHHHQYGHKNGETHEHDHEQVLDHEHKHRHLHEHEHHHHDHENQTTVKRPVGMVNVLPPMDKPMTLPSFPDKPAAGPEQPSTLPFHPDPQIPGQREPTIHPFPDTMSPECPAQSNIQNGLLKQVISEDPLFNPTV